MKIRLSSYILLLLLCTYLFLHFGQHYNIGPTWLRYYGKDLILVPILLLGTKVIGNEINRPFSPTTTHIVVLVAYVSLVFEGIIPHIKEVGSPDLKDIFMYVIGGITYLIFNQTLSHKIKWKSSIQGRQ